MTHAEARDHCAKALANAKPGCYVPVSAQALALVLEEPETESGETSDEPD